MTRTWFYRLVFLGAGLGLASVARYVWNAALGAEAPGVCIFHAATGAPCPACGTTRSVAALLAGDLRAAWDWNPLGFLATSALVVLPVVAAVDLVARRETLWRAYLTVESTVRRPPVAIALVVLLAVHWTRLILRAA